MPINALRITVGAIFLGFGVLKFFPSVSPAESLSIKTIDLLTFGLIAWEIGIVAIAALGDRPTTRLTAITNIPFRGGGGGRHRVTRDPR